MSPVLVKLMDKGSIIMMGLSHRLNIKHHSLIFLENLRKKMSLLWLADRIASFLNSFVSRISSKHTMSIRHLHGVHMTSQDHIKVVSTSCLSIAVTVITWATVVLAILLSV